MRQSGLINADQTPWPQRGRLRWLWVALSSTTAIYKIASRRAEELRDLIGEAFLGWLVSDGYVAYRDHPRRQRCLAHLIRKGIWFADGFDYDAAHFGAWWARELRALIHAVAENTKAGRLTPILARLKRACSLNEDAAAAKARALAREILNDWEAITAFGTNPRFFRRPTTMPRRRYYTPSSPDALASAQEQTKARAPMPPSSVSSKHADDENSTRGPSPKSCHKRPKGRSDLNAACSYAANLIRGR